MIDVYSKYLHQFFDHVNFNYLFISSRTSARVEDNKNASSMTRCERRMSDEK